MATHPLLSVWVRPRVSIERVLAGNPRYSLWLLAALSGASSIIGQLIGIGWLMEVLEGWAIAAVVVVGAIWGVIGLYFYAVCFKWSGKLFGGRASSADLRGVFAWAFLPQIAGIAICLALLAAQKLSNGRIEQGSLTAALLIIVNASALWSAVVALLMLARVQHFGFWRTIGSGILGGIFTVAIAFAIAIGIRTLAFQPFNMPSGSQKPTLLIGDYFFVSKYAYGYSRYSLPFSPPLFSGRIFAAVPQRGDLVVFGLPSDPRTDYVKRIVGLPGDRIQMIGGLLHLNGQAVKRQRIADFVDIDGDRAAPVKQWRETLPNGVSYDTLDLDENGALDNTASFTVPAGHYFVMGDNRDNSVDSRMPQVGFVPFENLIGRVAIIYYSAGPRPGSRKIVLRKERIGLIVR